MAARARLVGTKSLVSRQDALKMGEALGGTSERLHYTAAPKRPARIKRLTRAKRLTWAKRQ